MSKSLSRLLRKEQFAYLARDRSAWGEHLERVQGFLGEGLQSADPARPVLILGAGSGLEVPWALAPRDTIGWDADPWSRVRTTLRHHRWLPWVFEDLTGGLAALEAAARRSIAEPWSGHRRDWEMASRRLAGLLPSLHPNPSALRTWIKVHQPGTILAANVMGQFGVVAERLVETAFGLSPWQSDPERHDPLAEAMEAWTRRTVQTFLKTLRESDAELWLVHDRAVVFSSGSLRLEPWEDDWTRQLHAELGAIEASDALAGVDALAALEAPERALTRKARWLWPVVAGQRHLIEAVVSCRKP